ncbi:MAG: hypothetical protein ACOVOV_04655 [Dolichospermum sp.]
MPTFNLNFTGNRITDPIKKVLITSGVSSVDLATYDALPLGGTMCLTTNVASQTFQQTIRANALSMLTGAYRINGADTLLDQASSGTTSNSTACFQGSGSSSTDTLIKAGTLPIFAFLNTGTGGGGGNFKMRRTNVAYVSGSLITAGVAFNTAIFPDTAYPGASARYYVFVQKLPTTNVPTIDNNADGGFSGNIGMSSGPANWIQLGGYNGTVYTSGNLNHRQWQAIAATINW